MYVHTLLCIPLTIAPNHVKVSRPADLLLNIPTRKSSAISDAGNRPAGFQPIRRFLPDLSARSANVVIHFTPPDAIVRSAPAP